MCLAGLLLTGCSSPGQPSATLPSIASTTAAPSATGQALPPLGPEGFPVPDAARHQTPDGVLAMATYWLNHGAR